MQEIRLSNKTNKLELDPYSYQLQDVESPELFREMFPYTETPKIAFNYRRVAGEYAGGYLHYGHNLS